MSYDIFLVFNSTYEARYKYKKILNKYFKDNGCYYITEKQEIIFPIKRNLFKRILIKLKIKKYKYNKVRVKFIGPNKVQAIVSIYNRYYFKDDTNDLDIVKLIAKEYEKGEKM